MVASDVDSGAVQEDALVMATMVNESHSGEHVRTFILPDKGEDVIAAYVERGFSVARCVTRNTVELVSGRAVVTVTKNA